MRGATRSSDRPDEPDEGVLGGESAGGFSTFARRRRLPPMLPVYGGSRNEQGDFGESFWWGLRIAGSRVHLYGYTSLIASRSIGLARTIAERPCTVYDTST